MRIKINLCTNEGTPVFCVGLTGNIGSGKSTVAKAFFSLGVPILSADKISKELTTRGQPTTAKIITHFGPSIETSSGEIDRAKLRQVIFNHPQERQWLESLLHPLIRNEITQQINKTFGPYCLIEIPLLRDKTHYPYLNRILVVLANKKNQLERLTQRDKCTLEDAKKILATQASAEALRSIADDVLMNDSDLGSLKKKVEALHGMYLKCVWK